MVKDSTSSTARRAEHFSSVRHMVKNHMSVVIAFSQLLEQELEKKSIDRDAARAHLLRVSDRAKKLVEEIDTTLSEEVASRLD